MTPREEIALYQSDRAAWAAYIAPRWASMLVSADQSEKARLWKLAGPELKAALRNLASERKAV